MKRCASRNHSKVCVGLDNSLRCHCMIMITNETDKRESACAFGVTTPCGCVVSSNRVKLVLEVPTVWLTAVTSHGL